jgi:serine/threonine protein kinase
MLVLLDGWVHHSDYTYTELTICAAPESIANREYSAASDVWAFGVVIWECIHRGATPFDSVDLLQGNKHISLKSH